MMNLKTLAYVFAACLCLLSCVRRDGRETMFKQLSDHRARTVSVWADWRKKDLREKIAPAPDVLVDYLGIDNKLNGYNQVPRPAKQWQSFADEVFQAIDEFPPEVKRHLNDHVIGIFLVVDLGTSAYSEVLKGFAHHSLGFIVLDSQALDRKANEWASWRENTPFKPCAGLAAGVLIEPEDRDLRKNALSYIILHELGHLVGVAKGSHADWWDEGNPADYVFASMSWVLRNGSLISKWDDIFYDRSKVRFYADEKSQITADKIPGIYANLAKTDFVSLYAATGIYDDFAETYAMYVHVVLQKKPWQLAVLRDGKPVFTMTEPIQQERCGNKRKFLATLFESQSQPAPIFPYFPHDARSALSTSNKLQSTVEERTCAIRFETLVQF